MASKSSGLSVLFKIVWIAVGLFILLFIFVGIFSDDDASESGGLISDESMNNDSLGSWFDNDDDETWYDADSEDYSDDDAYWAEEKNADKPKKRRQHPDVAEGSKKEIVDLLNDVVKSNTEAWTEIFAEHGKKYRAPKLRTFTGNVSSECGDADYDDGPFYCYLDESLYIDPDFVVNMREELDAGGNFAYAYVIAHEVGHHVQYLLGDLEKYSDREEKLRAKGRDSKANLVSVQVELQADFYAGIWASHEDEKYDFVSEDDIINALEAAISVGDDVLGEENAENFAHGSAEMRLKWLVLGMEGDLSKGNTFRYKSIEQLENIRTIIDEVIEEDDADDADDE